MTQFTRRAFLKNSIIATTSASLLPALLAGANPANKNQNVTRGRVIGANDDVRYAVVGFNGRGADHLKEMRQVSGTRLVALCDADSKILDREVKNCEKRGEKVQGYTDIRKLLENDDIDVITIATPNHWHALGSIWAIQAGKDVYVEKPVCHNVWEGQRLVEAARKYERIVQAGTQSRSSQGIREAIQWVRDGNMGKIIRARGLCYKRRPSIGKVDGPQPIPAGIDYDLWCGPAPKEPLMRKKLHYDWHWVWPTGNGDLGNQGIHQMDISRWILGETTLSPKIWSIGGRLGYVDDGTTPNTEIVIHQYAKAPLIFEVRGLPASDSSKDMDQYHGASIGVAVDLEGGRMLVPNYTGAKFYDKDGKEVKKFEGSSSHFENFIKAVRSRRREDLNADIQEGYLSSALCHTANISYRLGKPHKLEEIRAAAQCDSDMAEALGRMEEHLAANKVDLTKTPATLGPVLKMDPKTEQFIGNHKASQLLTRKYRKPFVVPSKV